MEHLTYVLSLMNDYPGNDEDYSEVYNEESVTDVLDALVTKDIDFIKNACINYDFIPVDYKNLKCVMDPDDTNVNSPGLMEKMISVLNNQSFPDTNMEYYSFSAFVTAYLADAKGIEVPCLED